MTILGSVSAVPASACALRGFHGETPDQLDQNNVPGHHGEMLDDRPERERREEREAADDEDHADEQTDEQAAMGREVPAEAGTVFLATSEPATPSSARSQVAADQHRDAAVVLYQSVLPVRPPKAEPLLAVCDV